CGSKERAILLSLVEHIESSISPNAHPVSTASNRRHTEVSVHVLSLAWGSNRSVRFAVACPPFTAGLGNPGPDETRATACSRRRSSHSGLTRRRLGWDPFASGRDRASSRSRARGRSSPRTAPSDGSTLATLRGRPNAPLDVRAL